MVRSIRALRDNSDDELIAEHGEHAKSTVVGTQYYVDELNRRVQQRALEAPPSPPRHPLGIGFAALVQAARLAWRVGAARG
jgi:hypothetical protein